MTEKGVEVSSVKKRVSVRKPYEQYYPCVTFHEGVLFLVESEGATPIPIGDHPDVKIPIFPPEPEPEVEIEAELSLEEFMRPQNVETAGVALAYYNNKHHTDYELVDALWSGMYFISTLWVHTGFTAKPRTSDGESSSAKYFFAEYNLVRPEQPVFHCCRILEQGAETRIGCLLCGDCLDHPARPLHPTHGFQQGLSN